MLRLYVTDRNELFNQEMFDVYCKNVQKILSAMAGIAVSANLEYDVLNNVLYDQSGEENAWIDFSNDHWSGYFEIMQTVPGKNSTRCAAGFVLPDGNFDLAGYLAKRRLKPTRSLPRSSDEAGRRRIIYDIIQPMFRWAGGNCEVRPFDSKWGDYSDYWRDENVKDGTLIVEFWSDFKDGGNGRCDFSEHSIYSICSMIETQLCENGMPEDDSEENSEYGKFWIKYFELRNYLKSEIVLESFSVLHVEMSLSFAGDVVELGDLGYVDATLEGLQQAQEFIDELVKAAGV